MRIWKPRPENTTNTVSGSRPDFSEKSENHEHRSELDPYSTNRAENQAIWNLKVLWIQWDPSGTPKLPYKIQNRPKIQLTPPGTVYTKLFRQPYATRWGRKKEMQQMVLLFRVSRTFWIPPKASDASENSTSDASETGKSGFPEVGLPKIRNIRKSGCSDIPIFRIFGKSENPKIR